MAAENVDDSESDIMIPNPFDEFRENSDAFGVVDVNDVMVSSVKRPKKKRKRVLLLLVCVSPDCWLLTASSRAGLSKLVHCLWEDINRVLFVFTTKQETDPQATRAGGIGD